GEDAEIGVIAIVVEARNAPRRLLDLARAAHARRKSMLLFQAGRSAAGQVLTRSHTGALASDAEILAAFLRRCGIMQVDSLDELTEAIELFAVAPRDEAIGGEAIIISGSRRRAAVGPAVDPFARPARSPLGPPH